MYRTPLALRWRVLLQPKQGHAADEYEDAWAVDEASGRFAVADGASESAFAALWARLLAEVFVAACTDVGRISNPSYATAKWLNNSRRVGAAEVMGLKLPWYVEMKRAEGAFATLLGLTLRLPTPG